MAEWEKLLQQARNSPNNTRFRDLCKLAELAGFIKIRQRGSHIWFYHPDISDSYDCGITLQEGRDGKAKPFELRQLLGRIENYDLKPKKKRGI